MRPRLDPRVDVLFAGSSVPVGWGGIKDGLGDGVIVAGLGVDVAVAGGATRRINFCSGRMTEILFSPFQAIKSASGMLYTPAIHESVSPLWTVW